MSEKYEIVKKYYDKGLWSKHRVMMAVEKDFITPDECADILNTTMEELYKNE